MSNRRTPLTTHQIREIQQARAAGYTYRQICEAFGISMTTAMRHGDPKHRDRIERHNQQRYAVLREFTKLRKIDKGEP